MDAVYEGFIRQIAGERLQDQPGDFKEAVARDEQRQKLQREIAALENKVRREKQFNIQVALNSELKRLRKELGGGNVSEKIMLVISGAKSFAKYLIIPSGIITFLTDDWLDYIRLLDVKKLYGEWITSIFLISISILIVDLIVRVSDNIAKERETKKKLRAKEISLENLTRREREIVKKIFENDSAIFEANDASVCKLESMLVVFRPNISVGMASFSYTLQPWVSNYLKKHPDYLREDK